MQLSELLQWLSLGQKTGTLLIEGRGVEKRIYFQNGRINSSSSSDQREYLGHFLVSHGYITEEELKMAMEVQEESNILLGKILVMINAISETDLLRLMRKKAEESIYDVFLWEEGNFEFVDGELPELKMVPLSLDVTGIIMEGLRRYDEWKRIRVEIPDNQIVPRIVQAAEPRHPLRAGEAHRPLHRRPAHDRGDRAADAQRRVQRVAPRLRGPPRRDRWRWSKAASARQRAAAVGVGDRQRRGGTLPPARHGPAEAGPADGLPDVQGRVGPEPVRRPRRRGDPRRRARHQGRASRRTASRARRSRSSRSRSPTSPTARSRRTKDSSSRASTASGTSSPS